MRPSETTSRPVSSSPRNRTSSIRSRVCLDLLPRLLDELVDVCARQSRCLEQHEQPSERRAQLVRDRGGEAGPQLLVGGELRQVADEEHERPAGILADPPPEHGVAEHRRRGRARGHEPALAVEHDDRLREGGHERAGTLFVRYHPFTIHSPSIDPPAMAPAR